MQITSDEIEQFNKQNELNNDSSLSPSPSAESDKLQSKLAALKEVKELCGFFTNLNNHPNDPKNLLDNLCSGLETFLGFDKDSKGYTGQGIVYSDLDRLCDGVMAFLSGVLKAVKDDDAVKTYWKRVDYDVERIKENLQTGKNGFVKFLTLVDSGLTGWERVMVHNSETVGTHLDDLNEAICMQQSVMNKLKTDEYHVQATQRLMEWLQSVEEFPGYVKSCSGELAKLDTNLRKQLEPKIETVEKVVRLLVKSAKKDKAGLEALADKVDNEIEKITTYVDKIKEEARDQVEKYIKPVEDNTGLLLGASQRLDAVCVETKNMLDELKKNSAQILVAAKNNEKKIADVNQEIKTKLNHNVTTIVRDFGLLNHLFTADIQTPLNTAMIAVNDSIAALGEPVDDTKMSKTVDTIFRKIKEEVDHIKGDGRCDGLQQTVNAVKRFFNAFGNDDGFGNKVGQWIAEILKDEQLNSWLDTYIRYNKKKSKGTRMLGDTRQVTNDDSQLQSTINVASDVHTHIISCIKSKLSDIIKQCCSLVNEGIAAVGHEDAAEVVKYVQAVQLGCNRFTELLRERIRTDEDTAFIDTVIDEIGNKVKKDNATSYDHHTLRGVVRSILPKLVEFARQSNTEIAKLVNECNIAQLTTILDATNKLDAKLQAAFGTYLECGPAGKVDKAIGKVREHVNNLEKSFLTAKGGLDAAIQAIDNPFKKVVKNAAELAEADSGVPKDIKNFEANITNLQYQLNVLTQAVQNAKLTAQITSVSTTLSAAKESILAYIMKIAKEVRQLSQQAQKGIKHEALVKFAESKIEALEKLGQIVKDATGEINNSIEFDQCNGVKGMLKKLQETFVSPLTTFLPKASVSPSRQMKLADLSAVLRPIFAAFFRDVFHQYEIMLYDGNVNEVSSCFDSFLNVLQTYKHFDYTSNESLENLQNAFSVIHVATMNDSQKRVLGPLIDGMAAASGDLANAYVSTYSGQRIRWVNRSYTSRESASLTIEPTESAMKCGKVFFTSLEILSHDLTELQRKCKVASSAEKINQHTRLGDLLKSYGFIVSSTEDDQNGELRNKPDCRGTDIMRLLVGETNCVYRNHGIGPLEIICNEHLSTYYLVRHLATSSATKHPSSVYQMLLWFAGLPHNPVYNDLSLNGFGDLFEKPKEPQRPVAKESTEEEPTLEVNVADTGDAPIPFTFGDDSVLEAYPYKITATGLWQLLAHVCAQSHSMLTAVLGHGHADGIYAVDFNTNEEKLAYPTSAAKCLDTLAELLFRLYHQLSFLNVQCERNYSAVSWRDCYYGRNIGGSSWECNTIQCPNQRCPQKVDQTGKQNAGQRANQSADQTCELHPKCGLKSPLQSFLEDGLPGFLPHPYKKANCNISCDMAKHRGLPCKTPMGFSDISVRASHTQKGEHLAEALAELCGKPDAPLALLCAQLTCLLQRAPQTLDDMFSFYYHLLSDWNKNTEHKQTAFNKAVTKANFGDVSKTLDVTSIFKCRNHRDEHKKGDLYSLVRCEYTGNPEIDCGRYLQPMSLNTWFVFCNKNGSKYLSWIVYLTETFYDLLKQLYEECCNNCNKPGTRCYGKICAAHCQVQTYYKSQESDSKIKTPATNMHPNHDKLCKSIANCPFTRPTLSKYGFVLHSPYNLSGANGEKYKRTCQDLCNTLKRVISDVKAENNVLAKLVHETIPYFLFKIRAPFIWLNVALWLLSLLYLLHIMVIRLDLLRIKSHLHSPSSHRIAAQSLLAAGRVNKLNRVFYLQP